MLGLEIGADDYITKPFSIREFRSRVRALLRRAQLSDRPERAETIEHENLSIDTTRRAVEAHGAPVQLTYVEFELLRALAASPGRVYSRQQLLEALWEAPTTAIHARSTSTSVTCGRRSSVTRASPSTSSPFAEWDTASAIADLLAKVRW